MEHFKYPSTAHLPFSQSVTEDDYIISKEGLDFLKSGAELIVTEKMDGGNVSLYRDGFHSRSLDAKSQHWDYRSKAEWAARRFLIPEDIRLSGESMAARRSVGYTKLPAATMLFGAWRNKTLLAWDDLIALAESVQLPTVSVIYRGTDFEAAAKAWRESGRTEDNSEGFVIRYAEAIALEDFPNRSGKWVRRNHVRTSADWRNRIDYELNGIVK